MSSPGFQLFRAGERIDMVYMPLILILFVQGDTSILRSKHLNYLTSVFEVALHRVEDELIRENMKSVEYELYPFDSDRIVITASNERVSEEKMGGKWVIYTYNKR